MAGLCAGDGQAAEAEAAVDDKVDPLKDDDEDAGEADF
jgi:hypothetical protein